MLYKKYYSRKNIKNKIKLICACNREHINIHHDMYL